MDKTHYQIRLTAAEMSSLWVGFMVVSQIHYVLKSFLTHIEDESIRSQIELGHVKTLEHMEAMVSILKQEKFPIPQGITMEDLNLQAPRLFSDIFYLNYLKQMSQFALLKYAISYSEATRSDIRQFFKTLIDDLQYLDQKATEILLCK